MARRLFTSEDTWHGGFYELALELGDRSDKRLVDALHRVWSYPLLQGCYLHSDMEPSQQPQVEPPSILVEPMHLYGLALLPDDLQIACGSFIVREDNGSDWLGFYLPMGALSQFYNVGGYPFDFGNRSHEQWRHAIDKWLADLGFYIFKAVTYRLGLIGHEVSGRVHAENLVKAGIPETRYIGYLYPQGNDLQYAPMNHE